MKKLLLLAGMFCFVFFNNNINAQTIYSQNFEVSQTATPPGWSLGNASYHPKNPGWTFDHVWPTHGNSLWNAYAPTHTYVAFVDDVDYDYTTASWSNNTPTLNKDSLFTGVFSCATNAHVFISFDLNFNNYTGGETGTIAYSTNGGLTWATAVNIPSYGGDVSWHNGMVFDLSPYIGGKTNVELAFTWSNAGAVSFGYCGWGMALDNINVYAPQNYDLSVTAQNLPFLMQVGKPYTFTGVIHNFGGDSIVSMNLNYKVGAAATQTDAITGISGFNALTNYNFSHNVPYTPSSPGVITVKFWADNLNGANADQNHPNDTLVATFTVIDSIQVKVPLFEEFNQASCDPCAQATPNLDSVLYNNRNHCSAVRYHVSWPGRDEMNAVTNTPFVSSRVSFYGVSGVPDAKLDGSTDIYPGTMSSADIQGAAAEGSPFKIIINQCTFDRWSKQYVLNATIKSYGIMPSGLSARVALTVDTITYSGNQSTETIPQYIFPQVAEDMLPNQNGTTLAAFSAYSTQTVNVSWTKNHPWGSAYATWPYDSTYNCHMVIWIQDNSGKYVYQSANAVTTDALGIQEEVSKGTRMEVYPNPTNGDAYVAYNISEAQNVNIEVYNMLGEKVYGDNQGKVGAGDHLVTISAKTLQSGVYFVRFVTDNGTTTQRLVIQQ